MGLIMIVSGAALAVVLFLVLVVVPQTQSAALDPWWTALVTSIIIPAIGFLLAWLLSSRLESIVTRPISQLSQTAIRITAVKDYSPRLRHHRSDELGDLIDGFNLMLAEIERRDAALQKAQQELEQKVERRTQHLRQEITDRLQAEKELAQQVARISLLNQITQAIANHQDLSSILSVVLGELTERLPADFGAVLLVDDDEARLRVAGCRERELETAYLVWKVEKWSVPLQGSGWDGHALAPEFLRHGLENAVSPVFAKPRSLGMQSAAALPLQYEGRLLGLLVVGRRSAEGFEPGEQEFLKALSEHVALAGHQARLYAELQKAYQELRSTQQTVMQHERLRALGQMASGVAHDINNALSPVGGFAELLLANEPNLSENGRRYLTHIKTASDDIAHIVSRLREFYRSRAEQEPQLPINLPKLLNDVAELTRPRWRDLAQQRGANLQVRLDLSADLPIIVGIEAELREALTNLVLNAVDATPRDGTITLRCRAIHPNTPGRPAAAPSHVVLEVEDTGAGMDEETRKRCLEPFFSTKGERGTGLGLAMVYGTVERHEGTIEIDSAPGRGTIMRIVLPRRDPTRAEARPETPAPRPLAPLHVLFVDDEPLLRELIREILETDGHHVTTASSGAEALEIFNRSGRENHPPQVVITDLGMPQMDGRELARRLKAQSPQTPVIMMTGWGKMLRADDESLAPVDALISKPPRITELQQALRDVTATQPAPVTPAGSAL